MKLLFLLVGMVMILEGMPYVAAPESMRNWLRKLSEIPASQLRMVGVFAIVIGLLICWVVEPASIFI